MPVCRCGPRRTSRSDFIPSESSHSNTSYGRRTGTWISGFPIRRHLSTAASQMYFGIVSLILEILWLRLQYAEHSTVVGFDRMGACVLQLPRKTFSVREQSIGVLAHLRLQLGLEDFDLPLGLLLVRLRLDQVVDQRQRAVVAGEVDRGAQVFRI